MQYRVYIEHSYLKFVMITLFFLLFLFFVYRQCCFFLFSVLVDFLSPAPLLCNPFLPWYTSWNTKRKKLINKLGLSCTRIRSSYASRPDRVSSLNIHTYYCICRIFQVRFEVVFYFQKYLRLSCIYKNIWGHLHFTKTIEVVFHLPK